MMSYTVSLWISIFIHYSMSTEINDPISPPNNKVISVGSSTAVNDVFNRLTSGMSNSPNPSRWLRFIKFII